MPSYNGVEVADEITVYSSTETPSENSSIPALTELTDLEPEEYVEAVLEWKGEVTSDYFGGRKVDREAVDYLEELVDSGVAEKRYEPVPPTNAVYIMDSPREGVPPKTDEIREMEGTELVNTVLEWKGQIPPEYLLERHDMQLSKAIDTLNGMTAREDVERELRPFK